MLEESQRVKSDGHLSNPEGSIKRQAEDSGPDSGAPVVPWASGSGCLRLRAHLRKMEKLYLCRLPFEV